MTEIEKIAYAKSFMDQLANGINPLDGTQIPEDDLVNNVRLSRCFFYVSDLLHQMIEMKTNPPALKRESKPRKKAFSLSEEEREGLPISEEPISIRDIAQNLNQVIDSETMKKISSTTMNNWLVNIGLLEPIVLPTGKHKKMPTEQGVEMGIFAEERVGQYGPYTMVLFRAQAQQFMYDNVEAILAWKAEWKRRSKEL